MDVVDLDLLRWCTERENWDTVKDVVTKGMCIKESWLLFGAMSEYYSEFESIDTIVPKEFKTWFRIKAHPEFKREQHELYNTIIDNVFTLPMPGSAPFLESIRHLRNQALIDKAHTEWKAGSITLAELHQRVTEASTSGATEESSSECEHIDINEIASHARKGGLYWRLEDLNKSLGPLSHGDFVIIAKRPEVGGTSFLCSEITFMLEQLQPGGRAVIFNNEEENHKLKGRCASTALGVNHIDLVTNPAKYAKDYSVWLGDKELRVIHDTRMTIQSVRRRLIELKPDIIGINVLLKVGGTGKKEDHDKFQELGERFRVMATEFAPVLAVVQADPSATGVRYISQDYIYKSKTALQGEADALIMIGTDEEIIDSKRYIHVAKNKIPPSDCTETKSKHIKSEVHFDIDTGRFESVNFKKHSRSKDHVYDHSDSRHGNDSEGRSEGGQPGSTLAQQRVPDGGVEDSGATVTGNVTDTDGDNERVHRVGAN